MKSVSAKNSTDAVSCPEALRKEIKSGRPEAAGGAVIETSRKKRKTANLRGSLGVRRYALSNRKNSLSLARKLALHFDLRNS